MEFEDDPFWRSNHAGGQKPVNKTANAVMVLMVMSIVASMVAVRFWWPDTGSMGGSPLVASAPSTRPSLSDEEQAAARNAARGGWMSWLEQHLPGEKPLRIKTDFRRESGDWLGSGTSWLSMDGVARPGKLKLWKPTLGSRDYEVEFRAGIEKKALGWAFRATDANNYYAAKILLLKPGEMSGASIVRYGVSNAQEFGRMELPLPLILHRDRRYDVTTVVVGNRFTTLIDGHVVDEWADSRLKSGGVGFFSDDGESAAIEWADFRERKGWLSRWMSATLFLPPGVF